MNTLILKAAGIDYEYGVKRFAGRAHLFEKALCKFTKDSTFSRIRAAYESEDMEGLSASAHEFKGMSGNIGLTDLYEAADVVVQMLRSKVYSREELSAAYGQLDRTYNTVYSALIAAMEEAQ